MSKSSSISGLIPRAPTGTERWEGKKRGRDLSPRANRHSESDVIGLQDALVDADKQAAAYVCVCVYARTYMCVCVHLYHGFKEISLKLNPILFPVPQGISIFPREISKLPRGAELRRREEVRSN